MKILKKKKFIIFSVLTFLIGLLIFSYGQKNLPSKITDPNDPGFVVENFKWDDYTTAKDLAEVFHIIFPIGTDKKFVEKILLQPGTEKIGPIDVQDRLSKTGGVLAGELADRMLYSDPRFKTAKTFTTYNNPPKAPFFNFAASGGGRATTVYYDAQDKLLNAHVYVFIVHHNTASEEK